MKFWLNKIWDIVSLFMQAKLRWDTWFRVNCCTKTAS